MLTHWTPAVTRALALARLWAKRIGADEPDLRHLLLGLLQEEEGRVALLIEQQGVTLAAARVQLAGVAEALTYDPALLPQDHARLSVGFEGVLHHARALALEQTSEA